MTAHLHDSRTRLPGTVHNALMRYSASIILAPLVCAAVLVGGAPQLLAATSPRAGGPCTQVGQQVRVKGTQLICVKKGNTRIWRVVQQTGGDSVGADLPDLAALTTKRSDVLPIDITNASSVSPYLGARSQMPHKGLHVNFQGVGPFATSLNPASYPAVRAVADGVVTTVERLRQAGSHQAYGLNLVIGRQGSDDITLNYSLEPFIMEPSPGFYTNFLKVKSGQRVKKGDVLAYLYVPPGQTSGTHLHVHMNVGKTMGAPTLFTPAAVAQLQSRFGDPGGTENGVPLPACIGYKVDAGENPLGTGALDCLN